MYVILLDGRYVTGACASWDAAQDLLDTNPRLSILVCEGFDWIGNDYPEITESFKAFDIRGVRVTK